MSLVHLIAASCKAKCVQLNEALPFGLAFRGRIDTFALFAVISLILCGNLNPLQSTPLWRRCVV
jgi:hypothetical protein